ncbi:hypothetical protein CEXT_66821 [Caerostris extrusa]|uniref:Uncharacterized protein n=1 Tax=Caerostris extrusa TaxID=172846 RepID=A0AAV4QKR4_CAEEX|nr:hypothetical protein CEXT_66821 [Caerostris extrusa]
MEKQCHYQPDIEIKLSILPLQGQAFSTPEELAKTVLSAPNPALLGHNPSVSPLSGLPHIRFDPPLPRSLISIRQGRDKFSAEMNLSFQNHLLFKGERGEDFGRKWIDAFRIRMEIVLHVREEDTLRTLELIKVEAKQNMLLE